MSNADIFKNKYLKSGKLSNEEIAGYIIGVLSDMAEECGQLKVIGQEDGAFTLEGEANNVIYHLKQMQDMVREYSNGLILLKFNLKAIEGGISVSIREVLYKNLDSDN